MASSFSEVGTTTEGFKKKKSQELHLGPAQFEKSVGQPSGHPRKQPNGQLCISKAKIPWGDMRAEMVTKARSPDEITKGVGFSREDNPLKAEPRGPPTRRVRKMRGTSKKKKKTEGAASEQSSYIIHR